MRYASAWALFSILLFHTSCGQSQTGLTKIILDSEIKDTVSSHGPSTMVRNVKPTRNGNILLAASWGGVFRYDGKSFTNLTSRTIGSHRFWDVLEDRHGNLWMATTDSGVYRYDGSSFQHFTTREGLADNRVMVIYEDKAGNIWLGTGHGASRYDGKSLVNFNTKEGLFNADLTTMTEDRARKLWFGTRGDVFVYDGKTVTVVKNNDGKSFLNVWSIIKDRKGNIWLGDNDGLWRYDSNTYTKVSERGAYAILEDRNGNIWTTGEVKPNVWALLRYDQTSLYGKKPVVTQIVSGPPAFFGIVEAPDGSIWFGSGSGVYRYDGKTITDFKPKESQK